jgi:hypothetical protein
MRSDCCPSNPPKRRFWTCMPLLSNDTRSSLAISQLNGKRLIQLKVNSKAMKIYINIINKQKKLVTKTYRKNSNEASDVIDEEKDYYKKFQ